MGIYLPNMEMPKETTLISIGPGGTVEIHRNDDLTWVPLKEKAVPVPPHGRMIDESEFFARLDDGIKTISSLALPEDFVAVYTQLVKEVKEEIGKCRTIIPAEEG